MMQCDNVLIQQCINRRSLRSTNKALMKLKHLNQVFYVLVLLVSCIACNNTKEDSSKIGFDKVKWQTKEGMHYPYRDQMLHDVLYNDTIRNRNKTEILALLGEPSYYRNDENFLHYTITETRLGWWTLHTKTMVIKFSANTIDWIKVHE